MMSHQEEVLVACIGNIFLGDDGFGVEVAQWIAARHVMPGAVLADYGIRGFDLAYALLEPWRAVIIVDAVALGGAPGSIYLLEPDADQKDHAEFNPHGMCPAEVLAMAGALGSITAPVYIVGCEPQDFGPELEGRIGLSAAVDAALPEAVAMISRLVDKLTTATVGAC
jgi:hydrogenase maturation protease